MKFYHGTSAEAAEKILVDGFGCNEETVWNCSDNGSTYFWAHAVDRIEGEGVSRAFESGLVTAAMRGSLDKRVIVFELDIPDEFVGNWVLEDHSCEGMAGAWVVSSNWLNARLNESAVTLRVFVREIYRPDFRWFLSDRCGGRAAQPYRRGSRFATSGKATIQRWNPVQ